MQTKKRQKRLFKNILLLKSVRFRIRHIPLFRPFDSQHAIGRYVGKFPTFFRIPGAVLLQSGDASSRALRTLITSDTAILASISPINYFLFRKTLLLSMKTLNIITFYRSFRLFMITTSQLHSYLIMT